MNYLPLIVTGCFCVLMAYAYGTTARPAHTVHQAPTLELDMDPRAPSSGGYDRAAVAAFTKLWRKVERDLTRREAARVLAQVYGITAENADSWKRWQ